jgi:hypothetical protein
MRIDIWLRLCCVTQSADDRFAKLEGGCLFMSVVKRLFVLASCLLLFTVTVTAVEIESRFAKFGAVKIHYQNRGKAIKHWCSFTVGRATLISGVRR